MGKGNRATTSSSPRAKTTRQGGSAPTRLADPVIFTLVALVVSAALFALGGNVAVRAGCRSIPIGPLTLAIGVVAAARGLTWKEKWRPLLVMGGILAGLLALGAPTWFGIYQLGDTATAPTSLSLVTAVPYLFFVAFTFLIPWGAPLGVLLITIGRDPRKLWSSGGRG